MTNQHSDTSICAYNKVSAEIHRLFPEGLKHAKAERRKPRHETPLHFVPSKVLKEKDGQDSTLKTITVELNRKTSQKYLYMSMCALKLFL